MRTADLAGDALRSIWKDRRQAALSVLGIVCGVAVIVAATAISRGARREAIAQVESMGVDNVIVRSDRLLLTIGDAALMAGAPGVDAVAPVRVARLALQAGDRSVIGPVLGVTTSWKQVIGAPISSGRWLSADDVAARRRVAILGPAIAARLFDGDPVGQYVRVGTDWFHVVGVLAGDANGTPAAGWLDLPQSVLLPEPALDVRLAPGDQIDRVEYIALRAGRPGDAMQVAAAVQALLRRRLPANALQVVIPRELLAARLRARRAFDIVLLSIGCLVVALGGLGIMNVTLAGIAERITEIGLRRAVGARRADIVRQFAAESAALCVAGALIGLPSGVLLSGIVGRLAGWPTSVSWEGLALAFVLAASAGLASGVYPARVAARWMPAEALRFE